MQHLNDERPHKCLRALISLALLMLWAPMLAARESPERVLVVTVEGSHEIFRQLAGELNSRGFEVSAVTLDVAPSPSALESLAREREALAALLLRPEGSEIQVWVVDRVTRKVVMRTLTPTDREDAGVTARQAVEILRASLLEVQVMPAEELALPATPAATKLSTPARAAPRWHGQLAPGAAWSAGGLGTGLTLDARLGRRISRRFSVQAVGRLPLIPLELSIPEGRIDWWSLSSGAGAWVHVLPPGSALDPHVGVQVEGTWFRTNGAARAPFIGRAQTRWVMRMGGHAGLHWWISPRLGVAANVDVSRTLPTVRIVLGDADIARWGRGIITGSVGVVVGLD